MTALADDVAVELDFARAHAEQAAGPFDAAFARRFEQHFPTLHDLFRSLYGDREDGREALAEVVALAAASWTARPLELRARDDLRDADPAWFASQQMLGGVCYVDRYAGGLAGIREQIPYFEELGL